MIQTPLSLRSIFLGVKDNFSCEQEIKKIYFKDYASADPPAWNKRREIIKQRCSSKTKKNVKFCDRAKNVEW